MQVEVTKYHLSGTLNGLTTTEEMSFLNMDRAEQWADRVNHKNDVPYCVTQIVGRTTGEVRVC